MESLQQPAFSGERQQLAAPMGRHVSGGLELRAVDPADTILEDGRLTREESYGAMRVHFYGQLGLLCNYRSIQLLLGSIHLRKLSYLE